MPIVYKILTFDAYLLHVSVLVHHTRENIYASYLKNQLLLWHNWTHR